jgi:hypothetical protein
MRASSRVDQHRGAVEHLGELLAGQRIDAVSGEGAPASYSSSSRRATTFEPIRSVPPMTTTGTVDRTDDVGDGRGI